MKKIFNFQFSTRPTGSSGRIFNQKRGFTLLYAILTSSLLLAIGLAVFTIAQKEAVLSNFANESQLAIYAADTGLECGLHWEIARGMFDAAGTSPATPITCGGVSFAVGNANTPTTGDIIITPFAGGAEYVFFTSAGAPYCFRVSVEKVLSPDRTIVTADGFNTCDASARQVQRTLEAVY